MNVSSTAAVRSDYEFGELPKSPILGDFKLKSPVQSPPEWGIWGAEADDNEAKKLVELTLSENLDHAPRLDPITPRV